MNRLRAKRLFNSGGAVYANRAFRSRGVSYTNGQLYSWIALGIPLRTIQNLFRFRIVRQTP